MGLGLLREGGVEAAGHCGPGGPPGAGLFRGPAELPPCGVGILWGNSQTVGVCPYLIPTYQKNSNNCIYVHGHIYVWARMYMDVYMSFVCAPFHALFYIALHVHAITLHVYVLCHSYAFLPPMPRVALISALTVYVLIVILMSISL